MMRKIFCLISLVSLVLLLNLPAFGQTNLSVQELKEQYKTFNRIANDPDVFWIVSHDARDIDTDLDMDLARGKFVSRAQFEAIIVQKLMLEGEGTLQEKVSKMMYHISASQKIKANLRKHLLPDLESVIKKRENSPNPNTNLNDNTYHQPNNSSFSDALERMTSDEHLNALSFDNILAASNGGEKETKKEVPETTTSDKQYFDFYQKNSTTKTEEHWYSNFNDRYMRKESIWYHQNGTVKRKGAYLVKMDAAKSHMLSLKGFQESAKKGTVFRPLDVRETNRIPIGIHTKHNTNESLSGEIEFDQEGNLVSSKNWSFAKNGTLTRYKELDVNKSGSETYYRKDGSPHRKEIYENNRSVRTIRY